MQPHSFPKRQEINGAVGSLTPPESQDRIVEALVAMNAAMRNIRLYPPTSGLITNSIRRAHEAIDQILSLHGPIEFSESEKVLLIGGKALAEKNRKKPQATAFLQLMLGFGIRSLSLAERLPETEFRRFLSLLSRSGEEMQEAGGFHKAFQAERFAHIQLDQKLYMAVHRDQQVVAAMALNDPDIARYLAGESTLAEIDRQKALVLARNPQWLARSIHAGAELIKRRQGAVSDADLTQALRSMIEMLDSLLQKLDKPEATRQVVRALQGLNRGVLGALAQSPFAGALGQAVAKGLDRQPDSTLGGIVAERPDAGAAAQDERSQSPDSSRVTHRHASLTTDGATEYPSTNVLAGQMAGGTGGGGQATGASRLHNAGRHGHGPLADVVSGLYRSQQTQTAERVLGHMARGLSSNKTAVRATAARNLSDIGERLMAENMLEGMGHFSRLLTGWVAEEKALSDPYRRIGLQLKDLARIMLRNRRYADAEPILDTFGQTMASGGHEDSQRRFAEELLRGVAGDGMLDRLLDAAQVDGTPTPGSPGRSLALLLRVALDHLFDRLRDSRDMSERVRLIKVLSEVGGFSPQILVERIKSGGPWYFLRNLVLLLGKLGREEHAFVLVPLLHHEDVRVRSEALNALHAIGGEMREAALIAALKTADERFRLSIVSMLGAVESRTAVPHLLQLLDSRALIASRSHSELDEKICTALGRIGSDMAIPALQAIAERKGLVTLRTHTAAVRQAARDALNVIAIRNRAASPIAPPGTSLALFARPDAGPPEDLPATLAREEARVNRIIEEQGLDAAVQLLLERTIAYAHAGELDAAGRLRERLSEINPLALAELIKADDAIAQGRKAGFNRRELETWRELYDSLTSEEANALYVALRPLTLAADETVVRQGEISLNLFFVHSGELKITCRVGARENLVSILGAGEVAGKETFFNSSVATVTIATVTRTDLGLLSREAFDNWSVTFPELRRRLSDFCHNYKSLSRILEERGLNRRVDPRHAAAGEILCRLENREGQPPGRAFRGNLVDISAGGICFHVRVASARMAHLLLGRRLQCEVRQPEVPSTLFPLPPIGRVVAVRPLQGDLFSVHLQFANTERLSEVPQGETAAAEAS